MSRQQSTGVLRLWWVSDIATKTAPTTTEINGGTDLTPFLRRDGLDTPQKGSLSDSSDVSSPFNKMGPGTFGGDAVTMDLYRDATSASDTAYSTLVPVSSDLPGGTEGFLVIRRFGGSSTAIAADQVVEVWPAAVNTRAMAKIADNDKQYFTVELAITDDPVDEATVA